MENEVTMEQIKKKDDGSWTPPKMKKVMTHFIDKWNEHHIKYNLEFLFTTYESADSKLQQIERCIKHYKEMLNTKGKYDLVSDIKGIFPEDITEETIKEIAKRITFNWNEGAPKDFDNPTETIIQKCNSLLASKCGLLECEISTRFNKLYRQVIEFSVTRKAYRRYTRKDLQMILRRVMFSGENVTEAILQERPDLTIKDVKDRYEKTN